MTQSPYEAALRLARADAREGDRGAARRLAHGDASLRLAAPARALARSPTRSRAFGLRRADAVRTVSTYTSGLVRELGVEPAREFAAFMDLELFLERPPAPLPEQPAALFVGVLELYKNVDGLARAWRLAAPRVPGREAAHRRPRHAARGRRAARPRPAGADVVDASG